MKKTFTYLLLLVLVQTAFLTIAVAQSGGEQCFVSPTSPTKVFAKSTWTYNSTNQTYTIRTWLAKTFVDNTYGNNAIGWTKGHSFSNLVGSDNLQLALQNGTGTKVLEFKIDYISSSNTAASGYKSLGVTGGDGKMLVGSSADVVSVVTSLDDNFNKYNYILTTNSPATDANYTPNATYPNWIYDVWYEVTVKASAFGASGFGSPSITGVHASPSKTGNNTEIVNPGPCPGDMKLGNLIWSDDNNDGIRQPAEKGISGLVVKLYADANKDNQPDGAALTSTTTDANGIYSFAFLQEGSYIVGVTKAQGYGMAAASFNSNNPNSDTDNDNNGVVDAGSEIRTNFVTLTKNQEPTSEDSDNNSNLTVDIGLYKVSTPPTGGEICYSSPTNGSCVNARILYSTDNGNNTTTLRVIFSKCFVDNSYGTNSIGWGTKGHTFGNLVGSDHVELSLFDANNVKKMQFKVDYISSSSSVPSGYKSLGVTGGEGRVSVGSASDVVSAKTSLDANFNDYGYVLTTNSPATDASYTPNAAYPNWIYDVWYEVTVKNSAFGTAGLGKIFISSVHASPSKTGNNTEVVVEVPCPPMASLGNLVFRDLNDNGVKDGSEVGVPNVTVNLYADNDGNNVPDGAILRTTTTNANGNYLFTSLPAGKYIVGIVVPGGLTPAVTTATSDNPNNDIDNDNNGVITSGGELRSKFITLNVSTEPVNDGDDSNGNLTLDFGLKAVVVSTLNLGDLVWNDQNSNGVKDASEPGFANVQVFLYRDANGDNTPDGPAIQTTTTNASGIYGFSNLDEGKYIVGITLPTGYMATVATSTSFNPDNNTNNDNNGIVTVSSTEVQSRFITLTAGQEPSNDGDGTNGNLTLDFGLRICGNLIIGDYVWEDTDKNGLQGENEYGISDVKVTITYPDGSTAVTYTNPDGYYYFSNLLPGTYTVTFETPDGFRPTVSNAGADDRDSDPINGQVTVTISTTPGNLTIDAGFVQVLMKLGNEIFEDLNENGVRDGGEPGIAGLRVNLYADDNKDNIPDGPRIQTMVTDANGNYLFSNLEPGNYMVGVEVDLKVWQAAPVPFTGSNPDNNVDKDNNGLTTFNNEIFTFNITLTAGGEPTTDGDDADGNLTLDIGLVKCPPPPASITLGNKVFNDVNNNGVFDGGDLGIAGATVNLYDDANGDNIPDGPAIQTTISGGDGSYGFNNLDDGKYIVGVVLPASYTIGSVIGTSATPDNDVDNDNNGVTVVSNEVRSNFITLLTGTEPVNDGDGNNGNLTLDFGLRSASSSSIGDFVWQDYNRNGIQDNGEPGFPGVTVSLTKPGGAVETTVTDNNGRYQFSNLPAGTYTVCFTTPIPSIYIASPANQGSDDTKDSDPINGCVTVVLGAGQTRDDVDAGFYDDIDDDDDGITDIVEGHGYDAFGDCDLDGTPNYRDQTPGCPLPPGNDTYGNPFTPLVWSDCPRTGFPAGDGINNFFDYDNDGIVDQLDLDSDNDGILDAWETRDPRMVDANRDGMVDGGDSDGDGLLNSADLTPNVYGGPGLIPQDLDRDGIPNYLDLDSDGDGLTDLTETREAWDADGLADGSDSDGDGVNDIYDLIPGRGARGIDLADRDNDGKPNAYDIDSDNDGITDNIEGQPTCSYKQPTGVDVDKDGVDDVYDLNLNICPRRSGGITPYDKDGDGIPDIYDLDTDNDGAPDVNEGSGIYGPFVTNFADTDGDGLIDQFDIFNIKTATGNFTMNVAHSNMGPNGGFDGPVPGGSNAQLPKSKAGGCAEGTDRDWRDISILSVTLLEFKGNLSNGKVGLTWVTTNEANMSHYIIERSINGGTFMPIAKVSAKGTGSGNISYTVNDDVVSLLNASVYYRLRQVEKTGSDKLSNVISFKTLNAAGYVLNVYPNPAKSYFALKVNSPKDGKATIRIIDIAGRPVLQQNTNVSSGTNAITFNDLSQFASGTYNVQLTINGETLHQKLIVIK